MNPSADGWIKKLLREVSKNETFLQLPKKSFYHRLKLCGYIYGSSVSIVAECFDRKDMTPEELCKVNHLLALYYMHHSNESEADFVESVILFYNSIDDYKESFIQSLLGKKKSFLLLESIIHRRIHIDDNVLTKNFNYFITNALLFVDVLAYQKFLTSNSISETYLKNFEATIETIALTIFELKTNRTKYDDSLIKLFESSLRYAHSDDVVYTDIIKHLKKPLERHYCLDIACMASWSDKVVDRKESEFLNQLGQDLELNDEAIDDSIKDIYQFYMNNASHVTLLSAKSPVKSFYDNSSKMVSKLISRNSKRLLKELNESKELMYLLKKSANRSLTDAEQKKVHAQLLDIIKSIPSLAIFMLPGGAILLPLFVKFIPKLLPSAFDDNRIED